MLDQVAGVQRLPRWLQQELRSDHAGEFGAVLIYRVFWQFHRMRVSESSQHRICLLSKSTLHLWRRLYRPPVLPLWRVMGWLTGALPALFGRQAVFATIEAVETFVDHHYQQQIVRLMPR